MIRCRRWFPWRARSRVGVAEGVWLRCGGVSSVRVDWHRSPIGRCVCVCEREVCLGCVAAFVGCCFACGCVLELVVCRVRFARVSCPRLRFVRINTVPGKASGCVSRSVYVRFACVCVFIPVRHLHNLRGENLHSCDTLQSTLHSWEINAAFWRESSFL